MEWSWQQELFSKMEVDIMTDCTTGACRRVCCVHAYFTVVPHIKNNGQYAVTDSHSLKVHDTVMFGNDLPSG